MTRALTLLAAIMLTAGCVTLHGEGQRALSRGRYDLAGAYFTQALLEEPGRSAALLGLGLAQYK